MSVQDLSDAELLDQYGNSDPDSQERVESADELISRNT